MTARTAGLLGGQYRPLSENDIHRMHRATLRLFAEVGFEAHEERALDLFAGSGATVDRLGKRVALAPALVERLIGRAPSRVVLHGREERHTLDLQGRRVHLGTGGTALYVLDPDTGAKRPSRLADVARIARLCDALDHIHFFMLPVFPTELPQEAVDANRFYAALQNTTKHVSGGVWHPDGIRDTLRVAAILAGGAEALRRRPLLSMICCVISPLKLDKAYTEMLIQVAESGVPLIVPAEPLSGATAPVTLAGTVLQMNAETLAGVMLAQLVNPGTPVLYGVVGTIADPRTLGYTSGAVEMGLLNAAAAQMAQFYGLPIYATAGMSDAKVPDIQAGYEKALTTLLVAMAGANYIHDSAGLLEFAMTVADEQYVIDNEINGMVLRALRGIETDGEALALDVIARAARRGDYLTDEHTLQHVRGEFFMPRVADRQPREKWEAQGARDARERAREIAREIVATHRPAPVPAATDRAIREAVPGLVA